MQCGNCQAELSEHSGSCPNCSTGSITSGPNAPREETLTDFYICFFLGIFGVHRFARGQVGVGLFMLFTFGGCGVLWLYDLVNIALAIDARKKANLPPTATSGKPIKCAYSNCNNLRDVSFIDACSQDHYLLAREARISRQESQNRASSVPRNSAPRTGQKAIVCPFCQQAGGVRVTTVERNKTISRTMFSLATGGIGGRYVKEAKCSNCRQKWQLG